MVRFETIDEGNWRIPITVADSQRKYVADTTTTLARAFAYRNARSQAYIIFDDDTPIGMLLYHDCPEANAYVFSELLIDEKHQRKGYGKQATKMVLDAMKEDGKYNKVILCYIEGNDAAKNLYEKFGFVETDRDEDEIIMELTF